MARWTIYDKNGNVKAITSGITFGSRTLPDLEYSGTWMDRKFVTISVKSEQPVNWQIGDFLIYRGEKFVLDYDPSVVKKARKNTYGEGFVYDSIKFNSLDTEMADVQFLDEVLSDNHIHYTSLPTFSFFAATIDDYADRLQANMNRYCLQNNFLLSEWWLILTPSRTRTVARGAGVSGLSARLGAAWDVAYHDEPSTDGEKFNQNVSISQSTVLAGLSNIYNIFGLHYVTSGRTLIIGAAGKIASHVFEYGKGNGLYEIERVADSEQQIVTKLYAYGNSTNLPIRYYSNMAKVCVGKVLSVQKVKHHRETARLYIHTDVPYSDSYFTGEIGIIPRAIVYIRSYGVTIIGGIIEQADGYIQVDVFLKTSEGEPDWHTTDSEGFATIAQNIKEGDEIVFVEGVDVDKWPTGHFSYIGDETVIPDNLAVNNLMLPGFPTQSLKDWCLAHGGTENQDGTVTWHGHTAFLSEEALAPYILSPNSAALGIREASKTWDGNDDTEDIYPTIENTGDDILLSSDIITDNGVFGEGDTIPNFSVVVKGLGDDVELNNLIAQSGESAKISMKDGYCGGREFSVVSAEKVEGGNWKLTLKRDYDESLQLYFPYSNNAAIGHTPVADEAYQLRGADIEGYDGDKFVWLGIDMPAEYVESSAEKLLDSALTFLEANDYTRYTYSPKVDDIYMAEQHNSAIESQSTNRPFDSLHDTIHEGDLMQFCDEDLMIDGNIYIDKLTIKEYGNGEIPTYDVTLKNHKSVGTLQKILNTVDSLNGKGGVGGSGGISTSQAKTLIRQEGDNRYIRRDIDDETDTDVSVNNIIGKQAVVSDKLRPLSGDTVETEGNADIRDSANVGGNLSVNGNALVKGDTRLHQDLTFGTEGSTDDFVQNEKGCAIYWDGSSWVVEADCMNIHKRLYAKTIQVDEVTHVGGENILSDASCIAEAVIPYSVNESVVFYRVLFRKKDGDDRIVYNRWKVGDMAYCQVFNINNGENSDFENKYYWRKVIGTSLTPNEEYDAPFNSDEYHYIDLSNRTGEYDTNGAMRTDITAGSIPAAEDPIIQMGYIAAPNDDPAMVIERQGVTVISGGGRYRRAVMMWEGIGAGMNPWTFPEPKVKLSPYDVRIIANKFLIKTDYGATYTPPINRGEWSNLPPETGQSDNLHRCYKDDIVQHNGATWICTYIQGSGQPAYTTEEPSDNAVYWQVYAQKGINGTNADVWTIGQDGYWYKNEVKYKDTDHPNGIVAEGKNGTGVEIKGGVDVLFNADKTSQSQTSLEGLSGVNVGECYTVSSNKHLYFYDGTTAASATNPVGWRDLGKFSGDDGQSSYVHIAYADNVTFDAQGNPTSATGFTTTKQKEAYAWVGLRTNAYPNDPTSYTDYEWNKVEGAQGAQGTSAASLVISDTMIVVNADSSGRAKAAVDKTVTITFRVGDTQAVLVDSQGSGITGVPAGVQAELNYVVLSGILVQATVRIRIPYNNSTFPSTLTVTLSGIDPTTGLTRTAQGTITLVAQRDGDNGEDAINPVLSNASTIVVQDIITKNIDLTQAYTDVTLYKGTTDVTSAATINKSTTGCSASITGNRVMVTAWGTSQGQFVKEATVRITLTYQNKTYAVDWKLYANLIGTFSEQIQADVKQGIAQSEWWDIDPTTGKIVESQKLGTFIQSSTENIAKLEETVGDPEDPTSGTLVYRTSAIEQHVDRIDLFVSEGSNLHPNPTFASYNPYIKGTNHETGTLVGSVEYGSTIGDYTSIWANEGAQLVALKVLTNTTTAATLLYANNSPTDNPRIRLTAGKTYTWSVLVAGDLNMIASASSVVQGSLYNSEAGDERQSPWKYIRANSPILWKDTTWKQLYATFEIPSGSEYVWFSWIPYIAVLAGATGRIVYGGIRLEEGTKPTIINYNGTEDKLVKTGIDITKRTIKFTADNFIVENNDGERSAWIDRLGNLGTSGNVFTGLTVIKASSFDYYFTSAEYDGNWQEESEQAESEYDYIEEDDYRLVKAGDAYFIAAGLFLIPDIFMLSDIVVFDNSLPTDGDPKQILLPFALPRLYGTTGYIADVVRTKTNYKVGTAHLLDMTELYMLEGKEFTFMTKQTSQNMWLFRFPRLEEHTDSDGMKYYTLDNTHPFDTKDFGTNPLLTIQYERLRFAIPNPEAGPNDPEYLYTDGIVPVVKQTGNGFLYNNITGF